MLTALDQISNQNHLQIMKAAIPYLPSQNQQFFSMYIKFLEFQNILNFYQNAPSSLSSMSACSHSASIFEILNDIRNYADPAEQESIDQVLRLLSAAELYSSVSQQKDL